VSLLFDYLAFALGLVFGSFANVLIFRTDRSISSLSQASSCLACGKSILHRDNIPVLSWLLLKGKCRFCGAHFSALYPLVELATGILFLACMILLDPPSGSSSASVGKWPILVALWWLVCAGIALIVIDFKSFTLPNAIIYPTFAAATLLFLISSLLVANFEPLARSVAGATVSLVLYGLIIVASPQGMGLGDMKLAGLLGFYLAWFGWGALFIGLLLPFLLATVFAVIKMVSKKARLNSRIAFGPWLILGAFVALAFGNHLWSSYVGFIQQLIY
jgi:leader peptidase (prepilin peptidase)/N-methyltransferase